MKGSTCPVVSRACRSSTTGVPLEGTSKEFSVKINWGFRSRKRKFFNHTTLQISSLLD